MAQNKYCGTLEDYQPVSEDQSRVVIMYGLTEKEGTDLVEWYQIDFYKKNHGRPSFDQVKQAIIADINERVRDRIISGFVWQEKPVWLSEENQLNFSQAVTPATLKIGEQADGTPIYETFETKTALKAFNEACIQWKQQCLTAGYQEKDSIDFTPYAEALQPVTTENE